MLQWPGVSVLQRRRVFVSVVGIGALALGFGVLSLGGLLVDVGDPASSTYARLVLRLAGSRLPW